MYKNNKKGFTIVELVVVIAIIAIMAAILIPTFSNLIRRANVSSDMQLIRNLNTALVSDSATNGKHTTMQSALDAAEKFGYDVGKINKSATDNEILWDSKNDVFCYFDTKGTANKSDDAVTYIPETTLTYPVNTSNTYKDDEVNTVDYWVISNEIDGTYSTYYTGKETTIETTKGFDAGKSNVTSIKYDRHDATAGQTVTINTNSGVLYINAEKDTVNHYGDATVLNIDSINTASYHEFGQVDQGQIKKGHIVIENSEAKIENLLLIAKDADSFDQIIVEAKEGAELPVFDRTDVNIGANGTLVFEVVTPTTDDFIYLTKAGVIEQIYVTTASVDTTTTNVISIETAKLANATSATTYTAAEQIANVGTKKEGGYLAADGTTTVALDDLMSISQIATEAKADEDAVETGLTKFSGGAGTEKNPYLIATAEQFLNIENGSDDANLKYYLLVSDIDFANNTNKTFHRQATYCLLGDEDEYEVKNFVLDGGGHDVSLSITECDIASANRLALFGYVGGTTVLQNFNMLIDHWDTVDHCFYTLAYTAACDSDAKTTFKDITVKSNIENAVMSGNFWNTGIFTSLPGDGSIEFINCDNYLNLTATNARYYAAYIGGYISNDTTVTFTDCDNYANLTGAGHVAMFIGNENARNPSHVTVNSSYNYGTISGALGAGLFAHNSGNTFIDIEESYAACNRGIIRLQSFDGFTYSIDADTGEISYVLPTTTNVSKVVISIIGHSNLVDENNKYVGSRGFDIKQEITPISSVSGQSQYKYGHVIKVTDYDSANTLTDTDKIYYNNELSVYYVENGDQILYIVAEDEEPYYTVSDGLTIIVTAYSSNGAIIGNATLAENS